MLKEKIGAEEIYLAPETEKIINADEIAKISLDVEKYPFIIGYDANQKNNIITELKKLGCDEIKRLDFADCIAVSMSMAQLETIKTLVGVERVEKDYDYKCLLKDMSENDYVAYLAGKNPNINITNHVKLAIFDTGVSNIQVDGFVNFVNDLSNDENGHGTKMAGIISSVVNNVENEVASPSIYSVVVANSRGFTRTSTIMQALDWAINNKIKIVCMCFGDYHKSEFLENMINRASNYGIIMVAAAGNDGGFADENRIMYPAAFDNVLSVGAKEGDTIANYSNGGKNADCYAIGSQITTDINGNTVNVIGTSGATAFVAGIIVKNMCISPEKTPLEIVEDIKTDMSIYKGETAAEILTKMPQNDIITKNESFGLDVANQNTILMARCMPESNSGGTCEGGCFSNTMDTAINLQFFDLKSGSIDCPGNEMWYKFTTNYSEAHANGSKGWYRIQTLGSLDTKGYLYDSTGKQIAYNDDSENALNFSITKQLEYGKTYYIKVMAYGNNIGEFEIFLDFRSDDHGNTQKTATEITGVYYEDKSVNGYLHNYGDVDYYTFVPERNCVMEIYTEGDTDTYGELYCASGGLLEADDDGNGNGNFKITTHLEAMKRYYIAVRHYSSNGSGDYTLRFKFLKDYYKLSDDYCSNINMPIIAWFNNEYNPSPTIKNNTSTKYYMYTNKATALLWRDEYLTNITFRDAILAALGGLPSETDAVLNGYGISYSGSDILVDMIVNVLVAFITPYIDRTFFNYSYNQMTDSDLMKMLLYTVREATEGFDCTYNDYRICNIYNESSLYVYGANGHRGKWSEIFL